MCVVFNETYHNNTDGNRFVNTLLLPKLEFSFRARTYNKQSCTVLCTRPQTAVVVCSNIVSRRIRARKTMVITSTH